MTIGEKIKHHRKMMGLTQTELGARLGVKTNAVSKWECGRVEDIPTSKIKAMAALFGVQPSYLIDEEQSQKEKAPTPKSERSKDPDIRRIERAKARMPEKEWAKQMQVIKASFGDYFSDDYEDDDIDE